MQNNAHKQYTAELVRLINRLDEAGSHDLAFLVNDLANRLSKDNQRLRDAHKSLTMKVITGKSR